MAVAIPFYKQRTNNKTDLTSLDWNGLSLLFKLIKYLTNKVSGGLDHLVPYIYVTSQIFNLECYTNRSLLHIIFNAFCLDPRKFYATQGPTERVGDFVIFIFEFSQILKIGSFDFIYFIFNYFNHKNMREGIKWLSQNKEIMRI